MKQFITILILMLNYFSNYSQNLNKNIQILSESEVEAIFTHELLSDLGISYKIIKTYHYLDKSGEFYLLLTENEYKKNNDKPLNDSIMGFCIKKNSKKYTITWKMKDFILQKNNANTQEYSIWFWTKYIDLGDFNNDGLIDPIIIYGTSGDEGISNGRIKFLIYYKQQKYAIRHQNHWWDFGRNTQIDAGFYNLPIGIQKHVRALMNKMNTDDKISFPAGYEENMNAKKTYFEE